MADLRSGVHRYRSAKDRDDGAGRRWNSAKSWATWNPNITIADEHVVTNRASWLGFDVAGWARGQQPAAVGENETQISTAVN